MTKPKTRKLRKRPATQPTKCHVGGCGRGQYARGLCQTHHRQFKTTGKMTSIRPYRERRPGTVKLAGLRLTPSCAETLKRTAKERDISYGALIAEVVEGWNKRRKS